MPGKKISDTGIIATKPVSFWNRQVDVDAKKAFVALSNALLSAGTGDIKGTISAFLSTVDVAKNADNPGYAVWNLIFNAYLKTIESVLDEFQDLFVLNEKQEGLLTDIGDILAHNMYQLELEISIDFFERPSELEFLLEMAPAIKIWLGRFGLDEHHISAINNRIRQRFTNEIHNEWRSNSSSYELIFKNLDSPFLASTHHQKEWQQYNNWLVEQTQKRMFTESFSLADVFVPLKAYFRRRLNKSEKEEIVAHRLEDEEYSNVVVDLDEEILAWVKKFDADNCIKILSGGPGSGKSSCARMLARKIYENVPDLPVVYVPLHQFDVTNDLVSAMADFIAGDRYLSSNPLDPITGEPRILVIFDGLDELAMQGKAAAEIAKNFVDLVLDTSNRQTNQNLERQYLITGREIAVQAGAGLLRKENQVLHILPFFVEDEDNYVWTNRIENTDQRDIWWERYGTANGKNYKSMPETLKSQDLSDITKEPLLNYLVALSFERGEIDFSDATTLNEIYDDMLRAVYERQYEGGKKHDGVGDLSFSQFVRVLEEIALTVWHGNGRKATINQIVENCNLSGLQSSLEQFQHAAKAGVSQLLAAFYFRKSTQTIQGEESFEFTHKSFGEFLISKRIVRLIRRIAEERSRNENESDSGWSLSDALEKWFLICGCTQLDIYVLSFLSREIRRQDEELRIEWLRVFSPMIEHNINKGSPLKTIRSSTFLELSRQVINSDETLIVALDQIADSIQETIPLTLDNPTVFGDWLRVMQGQRSSGENRLFQDALSNLNLEGVVLYLSDLLGTKFHASRLSGAKFNLAILVSADLSLANLQKADFYRADLKSANLEGAKLQGANLRGAILAGANLNAANLEGANLEGADLRGASLKDTNLKGANLNWTDLEGNESETSEMTEIQKHDTSFRDAMLEGANLEGASLEGARMPKEFRLQ